jgi:hypothetical protein
MGHIVSAPSTGHSNVTIVVQYWYCPVHNHHPIRRVLGLPTNQYDAEYPGVPKYNTLEQTEIKKKTADWLQHTVVVVVIVVVVTVILFADQTIV